MPGTTRRLAAEGRGRIAIRVLTLISLLAGSLVVLAAPASGATGTRSNTTPILLYRPGAPPGCPSFPSPNNSCPPTPPTLYPSPISVTGIDGTISDVNVTLNDLDYQWWDASDLDVMLVAPNGSRIMLMSDVCGDSVNSSTSLPVTTPIDLTFDDDAALAMPFDTACAGGTYRPTDEDEAAENFPFTGDDVFCGPPSSNPELCQPPTAAEASPTSTDLNVFNGISPTGTWKLYVVDDTPSDPGSDLDGFNGGWSISFTTIPKLSVSNVTVTEPDTGTVNANFTVSLSSAPAAGQTVTANYTTTDGTAKSTSDYTATSGTLTFNPGETAKTVSVPVKGDTLYEANEKFNLKVTSATGATLFDPLGVATITNNDPKPTVSIADVSATEGNSGSKTFSFTVTLSTVSGASTTVNYATADGTATTANSDYVAKTGKLSIPAGTLSKAITVSVTGDTAVEPSETFFVNLTSAVNATIADSQGQGTITNDDA